MYELARVRLFSIGPAGARYSDVLLDLSEVGAPVRAPKQEALFGHAHYDVPRRPSPASVLFLENGGGKSVLMKLIFSVMLPGRRQVVGTTNTRVLEKFVRAGDVAHVLLEWQHVRTGERIVTGKVSEWRGHVVSSDPAKLIDAWYSFRPTAKLDLDRLPFTDNGRVVTLSGFHERLNEAHRVEPALAVMWTTGQSDWTTHLTGLGLDPELFRYQRAMNAGEGEAAEAFTFRSDDAFVDFLLRAVIDEEDPRGLADVVAGYADKLAQRGTLGAERHFVAGALDRLTPLADKESQAAAARNLTAEARLRALRFRTAVAQRHESETAALAVTEARLTELAAQEQSTDREQARLYGVVQELRRLVAGMRLREALDEKDALEARLEDARTSVAAWRETETVLGSMAATNRAEGLRLLVGEQEQAARPALEARNAAARALARGLLETAARAEADAGLAVQRAESLRANEKRVSAERDEFLHDAAGHTERGRGLSNRVAEARDAVAAQVRAGLLPADADVAVESRQAEATAEAAGQLFADALTERDKLAADTASATESVYAARRAADTAEATAAQADRVHQAALAQAQALAAEPRLAELLGADRVELDDDLAELLQLLGDALGADEQRATELRIADTVDRRTLAALGDGGLLPAADDVAAAVRALADAGITAWPGWRYLSTVPAGRRDPLLRAVPHLVAGVVVNDAAMLGRAEQVLTDARLLPRSVVAVGSTGDFAVTEPNSPAGLAFLVPPNPAMYDEEQAEAERVAIDRRHHERQAELRTLTARLAADRHLVDRLNRFRADYPSATVSRLRGEHEDAATAANTAVAKVAAAEGWRDAAKLAEDELRVRTPQLKAEADKLWQRAAKLAELAGTVGQVAAWTADAAAAQEAARVATGEAERAAGQAEVLRERAEAAVREADDHRRTAHACRQELRDVPGGGSVTEADPAPAEPLDVLRAATRAAADAYAKAEVGGNLRAELEQAEQAESLARAKLAALRPAIRDLAGTLVATPDGSDPAARAAAGERAERKVLSLDAELIRASAQVGALDAAVKQYVAKERSLEPYGKPNDIEHGEDLVARAEDDLAAARARHDHTHATRLEIESAAGRVREACGGFRGVLESLHGAAAEGGLDPNEVVEPFGGDPDFARSRRDDIWASLDDAEKLLTHAESQMRSAADELAQYASESQFEHVTSPVRRQMVKVRRAELPVYAAEWERALRPRLRSLDDDLAQIGRHRSVIVERLTGMVSGALRVLRAAQRLSMLPDGLGNWSGQEFLRMRFADVEESVLAERLGEVIDEVAQVDAAKGDSAAAKRDGMSLLLRGVHAAVPKGFRVEMLKPDAVLRTERLRVSEIRDVFSGGQQLTAAIILYCTMAALRANDRGKIGLRHSGVLFLDNPIGRASAGYLLELQLAVAEALGVQLVYTTGLFDSGALSVFPLIIRLRNDADLRAGLKYLSVDAMIRKELAALGDPDSTAQLGATRMFLRPPAPEPEPEPVPG